jgi:hypothetical protein
MWLSAMHFAVGSTRSWPSVRPNSRQSAQQNKTAGLKKMPKGPLSDGD